MPSPTILVCREYEARDVQPLFWRPLTLDDITNYAANARSYNQMLGRNQQKSVITLTPHDVPLAQHVATGGSLPDDFIVLVGKYEGPDGCVSVVGAWYFSYKPREILMDAVLITNLSPQAVSFGGLLGAKTSATALRPAASLSDRAMLTGPAEEMSATLAPNRSIRAFRPASRSCRATM